MHRTISVIGYAIGVYLVLRAAVEPFIIDWSDPDSYGSAWGGPSLFGVLLVHCGPGLVALALMVRSIRRRRQRRFTAG